MWHLETIALEPAPDVVELAQTLVESDFERA